MPTATKPKKVAAKKTATSTLELDGLQAATMFPAARVVAAFASTDWGRPVLCCVHAYSDGKTLTLEASDSYRLARIDLKGFDGLGKFDFVVDAKWLVANLRKGRIVATEYFTLNLSDRIEVVDHRAKTAASIALIRDPFPNLNAILTTVEDAEPDDEVKAFDPRFLNSIFRAAVKFAPETPVRVRRLDPLKPCRFDVVAGVGTLTMVMVPVRTV